MRDRSRLRRRGVAARVVPVGQRDVRLRLRVLLEKAPTARPIALPKAFRGPVVSYEFLARRLREVIDGYGVKRVAFDLYNFSHLRP